MAAPSLSHYAALSLGMEYPARRARREVGRDENKHRAEGRGKDSPSTRTVDELRSNRSGQAGSWQRKEDRR